MPSIDLNDLIKGDFVLIFLVLLTLSAGFLFFVFGNKIKAYCNTPQGTKVTFATLAAVFLLFFVLATFFTGLRTLQEARHMLAIATKQAEKSNAQTERCLEVAERLNSECRTAK